jgi:3'(2'), 5'-bisphosphate nucleotidase
LDQIAGIAPLLEPRLIDALTDLAARAAAAILTVGRADLATRLKPDRSPVTAADEAAEAVVLEGLSRLLPGVPVVSEERAGALCRSEQVLRPAFVLVDPLDGTRELVAGRDEYTVNVALVANDVPLLGVVAAPALGLIWRGAKDRGAERLGVTEEGRIAGAATPIRTRAWPARDAAALVSRSHLDSNTSGLLDLFPGIVRRACGSALKFCRLAEGSADIYPRLAPTSEWDVAAGHAVLAAAGGVVLTPAGMPVAYGRPAESFRVPAFIALGDPAAAKALAGIPALAGWNGHSRQ